MEGIKGNPLTGSSTKPPGEMHDESSEQAKTPLTPYAKMGTKGWAQICHPAVGERQARKSDRALKGWQCRAGPPPSPKTA
jgi:hypothetical protein